MINICNRLKNDNNPKNDTYVKASTQEPPSFAGRSHVGELPLRGQSAGRMPKVQIPSTKVEAMDTWDITLA